MQGVPGYYVPMEAIALAADGDPAVFVVESGSGGDACRRVPVELGETVGTKQRIASEALADGTRVVLRGAAFLVDGEPVSVTH